MEQKKKTIKRRAYVGETGQPFDTKIYQIKNLKKKKTGI